MDLVAFAFGFGAGCVLGIWGMLTMSRNADLRVKNKTTSNQLAGEKRVRKLAEVTLEQEVEANRGLVKQLTATEKLVVEQSRIIQRLRRGEPVADSELPDTGGSMLDRLLDSNKGREGSGTASPVREGEPSDSED